MPDVIEKVVENEEASLVPHDTVFDELKAIAKESQVENRDLAFALAIYLLGFSSYTGFRTLLGEDTQRRLRQNDIISAYVRQLFQLED